MEYRLIKNSLNDINNPKETVLLNRGITDWKKYLNLSENCTHDFGLLNNMNEAVSCYLKHINNNSNIHIIVDCDVDGFTSASMIYRYTKKLNKNINVTYSLHDGKEHGLSKDITLPESSKYQLLIIPDAGSNDVEQCKKLKEQGIDIIILDHHECDVENDYAIIVNNQISEYPNKNLCGAGIVFKFLQALDEELWESYSLDMLDLNALANISDNMDIREHETKYYIDLGLKRIKSKAFKALIEKQAYSMNDVVNINSVQFYITPILNALIRIGSQEEKEILFKAFIETDEVFKYKKRGETKEVDEDVYTRAARLCYNAKNRQGKEVQKGVDGINESIEANGIDNHKVLFVNVTDIIGQTLTGLAAIKIAEKYNKPCVLLRRQAPLKDGTLLYGGSCRNPKNSSVDNLKEFLTSTELFEFVQGHPNAAGVSIKRENINNAINICDEKLKDSYAIKTLVDFDINYEDITVSFIKELNEMKDIYGHGIEEPLICIKNIPIYIEDISVMGKNLNTWKVIDSDGYAFVKFNVDKENDALLKKYNKLAMELDEGIIGTIDIIGKASINNFKGILTPQIVIEDYEFKECA